MLKKWLVKKSRFVLITTFICTLCTVETSTLALAVSQKTMQHTSLTVMSYNIYKGIGPNGKYNLDQIAAEIEHAKPDLVGLQEVAVHWDAQTHYDNQAALLSKKLHMYCFFAPTYEFSANRSGQPAHQWGVALLSRFPIVQSVNHPLLRWSTVQPYSFPAWHPGLADCLVELPGASLRVFVTHLDYRKQSEIRRQQVEEMVNYMGLQKQGILLMGDLNASPQQPELSRLWRLFQNPMENCFGNCKTFPSNHPKVLLDYVLATPDFRVQSAEVLPYITSDHRPVKVKFILTPERAQPHGSR